MDLKQLKLSRTEWNSIEIPVSKHEINILKLIIEGYNNVNIKVSNTFSLFTYLKIEYNSQFEEFLYAKYYADKIKQLVSKYNISFIQFNKKKNNEDNIYHIQVDTIVKLKSADQIRLNMFDKTENVSSNNEIFENILMYHLETLYKYKKANNEKWILHYFTLYKLHDINVTKTNKYINEIIHTFIVHLEEEINLLSLVENSSEYIEKNINLLKYADLQLYEHQKQLFTVLETNPHLPKLILYIAPTATGKTMSPLGFKKKCIYLCAARHVGLAIAKSAISIGKKIAFAFGCSSAEDVKLHYFSAKNYTTNKRSGQIQKVDNSVGDKVELIICDIRSYIPAMYYMLAFNDAKDIITFWDEPTITLDYDDHELHQIIHKNWTENKIPIMILSSATLPKLYELTDTINDFQDKFINAEIINITSNDCRKSISLIANNGYVIMPHYLHIDYNNILTCVDHCYENLSLLRYFDLTEVSLFISFIIKHNYHKEKANFNKYFNSIQDVTMQNIKMYYLILLQNIEFDYWHKIYYYLHNTRIPRITDNIPHIIKNKSIGPGVELTQNTQNTQNLNIGMYITTKDAYTLTYGPSIFLANDLQKIAQFYIQNANIPIDLMTDIQNTIKYNNILNEKINELEHKLEFEEEKISKTLNISKSSDYKHQKKSEKIANNIINNTLSKTDNTLLVQLKDQLDVLKNLIKRASLPDVFIPNSPAHLHKWANGKNISTAFTCDIDDDTILSIMMLKDVQNSWKILLLMGIGVFTNHTSDKYTEIMKRLTDNQKLFMIIADSDYIYGTNYQLFHGYLSKDLDLTFEKIIQSLGRIGRGNTQQEYTVRFRSEEQIHTLFTKINSSNKKEVINMNRLFHS